AVLRHPHDYLGWNVTRALIKHANDATDPNLPFLYWYALETLITMTEKDPWTYVAALYSDCQLPLLRGFMARRIASKAAPSAMKQLVDKLAEARSNPAEQKLVLRNMLIGLKGRSQAAKPEGWDVLLEKQRLLASKDSELRSLAFSLAVVFGDAGAFRQMRRE